MLITTQSDAHPKLTSVAVEPEEMNYSETQKPSTKKEWKRKNWLKQLVKPCSQESIETFSVDGEELFTFCNSFEPNNRTSDSLEVRVLKASQI